MSTGLEIRRTARKLIAVSVANGQLNPGVVQTIVKKLIDDKPRGYLQLLKAYWRLVGLEMKKSRVLVESAEALEGPLEKSVLNDLKKKYGDHITAEFAVNKSLIGGMKITVGSDVWDGSVKNRIERLEGQLR